MGSSMGSVQASEDWPVIGQGINLDFATTEVNKIGYHAAYYDVFKAAYLHETPLSKVPSPGFDSVRFFVKQGWPLSGSGFCFDAGKIINPMMKRSMSNA